MFLVNSTAAIFFIFSIIFNLELIIYLEIKAMHKLCHKNDIIHLHKLVGISNGLPPLYELPKPGSASILICAYNTLGNRDTATLFVCESMIDMIELYKNYRKGSALSIDWYLALVPEVIYKPVSKPVSLTPLKQLLEDPDMAERIGIWRSPTLKPSKLRA